MSKKKFDPQSPLLLFAFNFMPQRGGLQTYSYELARHLHRRGLRVIVLARWLPGAPAFDEKQPFPIVRMKWVRFPWLRIVPMAFFFLLTVLRHRVRLVHCVNWIPCGFVALFFQRILRYRFVVACHGREITRQIGFFRRIFLRATVRRAEWLIAGNNHVRALLNGLRLPRVPISVVGYGVDADHFQPGPPPSHLKLKYGTRERKILLTVAQLVRRKGIDKVLEAVKTMDDVFYIIVGMGQDGERLLDIVLENGLEDRVAFLAHASDEELKLYYNLCDLYVMPVREDPPGDIEGFGLVFIEAGACEKPVIGGRSGGVADAVSDGKTGFLVDPQNAGELKEKIRRLLDNPSEARAMGETGRRRAISLYSWETIALKTEMIYRATYGERPQYTQKLLDGEITL